MALSRHGELAMELAWCSEQNHSVEVVPALRRLMDQANVETNQLDAVLVARGPGGFSALRVGISVAKALAMAQAIPLVAIGTLDIEAQPYLGLGMPVCALITAGRTMVYTATYSTLEESSGTSVAEYGVETLESLFSSARAKTLFCGEAVWSIADELREYLGSKALVMDTPPPTRRPAVLAQLGYKRLRASDTDDPDSLKPLYIRGSQFEAAQARSGGA